MRQFVPLALALCSLFGAATAQTCGPTPAMQTSTTVDGVFLDMTGALGSTNSRATTPDYTAQTGLAQGFSLSILSVSGPPGESIGVYYSLGGPKPPFNLGTPGKDVFIDVGQTATPFPNNFFVLAEGPTLGGNTLGFVTQAAPATTTISGIVTPSAALAGQCLVVQGGTIRPSAPNGFALTNAVTFEILPTVTGITPSQILPEAAVLTVTAPGAGPTDTALFSDGYGTTIGAAAPNGAVTVPAGAGSGPVGYILGGAPSIPTSRDPDRLASWFSVTNSIVSTVTPGVITLTPGSQTGLSRFTALNTLALATTTHDYTLVLTAGDVVEIEVLSTDAGGLNLLSGWGNIYSAGATQGFNPRVTFRELTNGLPITFDTGSVSPYNLHRDDDSGPGGNAFLRFQTRVNDTYGIRVDSSGAAGFVTGTYVLNVRIQAAAVPCVSTIGPTLANPQQVGTPGAVMTVQGANFNNGAQYNVFLNPSHGLFPPFLVGGNATSATALTFSLPTTLTAGTFTVGSYRVQLEDPLTLRRSLIWSMSPIRQAGGIAPDLMVVRAASVIAPVGGALTPLAANTGTMQFNAPGAAGFATITANPGQRIYVETVGLDQLSLLRVDTGIALSGATNGVWNPNCTLYSATGLGTTLGYNDDDGFQPFPYLPAPVGIGDGPAILVTTDATGANSTHTILLQENICLVSCAQTKSGLLNVVVQ